jgi:hypothetical protein
VEESRKTPPEQVKGIAAAGQKFTHALFAIWMSIGGFWISLFNCFYVHSSSGCVLWCFGTNLQCGKMCHRLVWSTFIRSVKRQSVVFPIFFIAICLRSFASFGSYTKFLLFWKPLSVISGFWPDVIWIFMAPIVDGCRAHWNHDDELLHKQCSFVAAECAPRSKTSTMITCIDNSDF